MTEYIKKPPTYVTYQLTELSTDGEAPESLKKWYQDNLCIRDLDCWVDMYGLNIFPLDDGPTEMISIHEGQILVLKKGGTKVKVYTPEEFKEKFEVSPYE